MEDDSNMLQDESDTQLFLWAKVLLLESLIFKSGKLFFPPISIRQVIGLRETLKFVVGIRGINNYLDIMSFRSCPPCTLRGINFENHGEYSSLQLRRERKESWKSLGSFYYK